MSSWEQSSAPVPSPGPPPGLPGPLPPWPTPPGYVAAPGPGPGPGLAPPAQPRPSRRPGCGGYVAGAAVIVVGSLVAILWFVALVASEDTSSFLRVPVPSDRKVDLSARTYALYVEAPGDSTRSTPHPSVRVTGPNGEEPVILYGSDAVAATYVTLTDRSGAAFATISPTVAGTYRVEVSADPGRASTGDELVAIGDDLSTANEAGYLAAVALGAVTFFVGIAVIIATAIRRRVVPDRNPDPSASPAAESARAG